MPQDIHQLGARHCFTCIQWDGHRTFDQVAKTIRVDSGSEGNCRVHHTKVKGTHYCDQFNPLK
jgi:hypothetical protein